MSEDDKTKAFIARHLAEGVSLNEIHKLLKSELKVSMTFLDLRLLSADLEGVDWKIFDPQPEPVEEEAPLSPEELAKSAIDAEQAGGTTVEISPINRPGMMMSGTVNFASGPSADWSIDNAGQLGLNLHDENIQPTQDDMMEFQTELRKQASESGRY